MALLNLDFFVCLNLSVFNCAAFEDGFQESCHIAQ